MAQDDVSEGIGDRVSAGRARREGRDPVAPPLQADLRDHRFADIARDAFDFAFEGGKYEEIVAVRTRG